MVNKKRLFVGSIVALVATAFGFVIRAGLIFKWGNDFNLSQEQIGWIAGAGLLGFPITIILFSLIIDKIGYHTSIRIACAGHVLSAFVTICAGHIGDPFWVLYIGTFMLALANGIVEAVVNPAVATLYPDFKTPSPEHPACGVAGRPCGRRHPAYCGRRHRLALAGGVRDSAYAGLRLDAASGEVAGAGARGRRRQLHGHAQGIVSPPVYHPAHYNGSPGHYGAGYGQLDYGADDQRTE